MSMRWFLLHHSPSLAPSGSRGITAPLGLLLFLCVPSLGWSGDVEDLQAHFNQGVQAFNSRNLNEFAALWHDELVWYGESSPFPLDGKVAVSYAYQAYFNSIESVTFTPITPQFRVIGDTGISWGSYALSSKPKDGPVSYLYGRYTFLSVKVDGKWLIAAMHSSQLPTGN